MCGFFFLNGTVPLKEKKKKFLLSDLLMFLYLYTVEKKKKKYVGQKGALTKQESLCVLCCGSVRNQKLTGCPRARHYRVCILDRIS